MNSKHLPTPLPAVWDRIADSEPDRVVVSIAIGSDVKDGYRDITARCLADAIHRAAWFLETELGKTETFETICYLGPSDLRYPILMAAASKVGYKTFWTSPRNSLEGHIKLMEATDCALFLTPSAIPPVVADVVQRLHMRHVIIPEQNSWLDSTEPVKHYPFDKPYTQCSHAPLTVIHTSGSTGFPKPIVIPHGFPCCLEAIVNQPHPPNKTSHWKWFTENPGRIYTPFPMFHGAGLLLFHHLTQFLGQIPVLPPPNQPVTPELSNEIICTEQVDSAFLPPAILDALSKVPEFTENLRKLRFVIYAGAPLATEVGDIIRNKTRLINSYGQTETGLLHQYRTDDDDYAYVNFGDLSNIQLQHQSGDLYEAVMVQKQGLEIFQAGFIADPKVDEIRTRDLFSRHPDPAKSELWIHRGRADDVIVFETGEKINPTSMEGLIGSHQKVKSVIVIGEGRFQSALLIEPVHDVATIEEKAALLKSLWPIIEDANRDCPAHGRVMQSHVLFSQPALPFIRTSKLNVNRTSTIELYKDAINQVYNAANGSVEETKIVINIMDSKEGLLAQVRELFRNTTNIAIGSDDDNFYQCGMDSLQTLQFSRSLNGSLRQAKMQLNMVTPSFVYSHPTLRQLSEGISELGQSNLVETDRTLQFMDMRTTLSEYVKVLPARKEKSKSTGKSSMVVVLTGSTGSFGSYLLHSLLQQESVSHVYCLNRSTEASSLQASGNAGPGLISAFDPGRVTFYTCDFSKPLLGLDQAIYDGLLSQITHIIHNAWTVNFNLSLSTFARTNIVGLNTLIQFSAESTNRVQIFFVSSIGTVVNWRQAGQHGAVPEEIIDEPEAAEHQGYAQSKWISEHLLHAAHKISGIDVCCLRVGQIAGPVGTNEGAWNNKEWFPIFLASCKSLGMIPNSLPLSNTIDWIPVNILADVVVELVQCGVLDQGSQVYNLVNPLTSTWDDLKTVVHRGLAGTDGAQIKMVDYQEWVLGLENVASEYMTEQDIRDNPAVKLLEFFQAVEVNKTSDYGLTISTEKAKQYSSILRACGPVTEEWMSLWVAQLGLAV